MGDRDREHIVIGVGCKRGVSCSDLWDALTICLQDGQIAVEAISAVATVDLKQDEAGIIALADRLSVPLVIVPKSDLTAEKQGDRPWSKSASTAKFGIVGVCEPCAVLVSNGILIQLKRSFGNCTIAIAKGKSPLFFYTSM